MTKGYREIPFSYFLFIFWQFFCGKSIEPDRLTFEPRPYPSLWTDRTMTPIDWRWTLKTFNALHRDMICRISVRWNYYITVHISGKSHLCALLKICKGSWHYNIVTLEVVYNLLPYCTSLLYWGGLSWQRTTKATAVAPSSGAAAHRRFLCRIRIKRIMLFQGF